MYIEFNTALLRIYTAVYSLCSNIISHDPSTVPSMLTHFFLHFLTVAVNTGTSLVLSSLLSVLVFAGMQMFSRQLGSSEWLTILGGFLGSVLFICSLTVSFLVDKVLTCASLLAGGADKAKLLQ